MTNLSLNELKEAIQIKEKIESLESRLIQILGGSKTKAAPAATKGGRKKFSAATIAKMRAAQQARWAKVPGKAAASAKTASKPAPKKGGISPEGRAKLAAAMKARWAAKKKNSATPAKKAAPAPKKKNSLSPEGRAKLAAMMKARWAAKKKAAAAPAPAKK